VFPPPPPSFRKTAQGRMKEALHMGQLLARMESSPPLFFFFFFLFSGVSFSYLSLVFLRDGVDGGKETEREEAFLSRSIPPFFFPSFFSSLHLSWPLSAIVYGLATGQIAPDRDGRVNPPAFNFFPPFFFSPSRFSLSLSFAETFCSSIQVQGLRPFYLSIVKRGEQKILPLFFLCLFSPLWIEDQAFFPRVGEASEHTKVQRPRPPSPSFLPFELFLSPLPLSFAPLRGRRKS